MWFKRWIQETVQSLLGPEIDRWDGIADQVEALEGTLQEAIRDYRRTIEDVDERIDRGNKQWRRIRAAQRVEEERESEEEWEELPLGDAAGGPAEGLPALPDVVEAVPGSPAWEEKKRALNRRLAGLE